MEPLITQAEAADILRLSPKTLERFRVVGGGPRYVKLGRRVVYRLTDLNEWVEANTFSSSLERYASRCQESRAA